ncbi:MAG: leucine-rich repeat protein [Roseburia sp.]|nr:leucine-rich repeat protein [Roseburia sp.]MCM1241952.1 leucine-rich repeat protein [Roseburia sp.]
MSKNASVKKTKRRLKRSVRRSLAAVLMITAIGVAAIPVPENYAEGETTGGENEGENQDTPTAIYAYPGELPSMTMGATLTRPTTASDIYKTYNIFTTDENESDGSTFRIEWQYEYFSTTVMNQKKDIICGYNSTYTRDLLEVRTDPVANYHRVSDTQLTTFKNTEMGYVGTDASQPADPTKAKIYFLPADPVNDSTLKESERNDLMTYFPEEYQQRVNTSAAYKQYNDLYTAEYKALLENDDYLSLSSEELQAMAEANVKNKNGLDPVTQPVDTFLSCVDFTEDWQWYRYYCDRTAGLSGCQLEKVADPESRGSSSTMAYTYIPRVLDTSKYDTGNYDSSGFYWITQADFIGIGNNVFKGVQNVTRVVLPRDLKYIGDSAFENSYITSITMANVSEIGNQAFKNCPRLSEVVLEAGVTKIGTEAFYGISPLMSMTFPVTLQYIGAGAFANCQSLGTLDFSAVDTTDVVIDDYAFYNDIALSTVNLMRKNGGEGAAVNVISIGEAAFAVDDIVTGSLTEFVLPTAISRNKNTSSGEGSVGLGDFIFAGRTNLKTVTMPTSYGSKTVITIPNHLFYNCINLESVIFPDTGTSCGMVKYAPDLFASVSNPDFYVQGPPYTNPSDHSPAEPRKSTWDAYTAVAAIRGGERVPNVPYVYYLNGKKHIEVSDGDYLESIDENGVLISCSLKDGITKLPGTVDLIIPAEVAGTTVTGIASDCFANDANEPENRKLSVVVRTLTLKDDSKIETIDSSVFEGWGKLQRVYIGNSVRNIGNNTFQNCVSLIDVYFNTPEGAVADFKMGTNAFQTNSTELTFHGPISMSYQPFTEAMDPANTIDDTGRDIRICYKSLAPTNLTVMRDNGTGQVTLLDYPKYDQIEDILGNLYAVRSGVFEDSMMDGTFDGATFYKNYMEDLYESLYSSDQYNGKRADFKAKFIEANGNEDALYALYTDFSVYGPWISRDWCSKFTVTTADAGNQSSMFDWLFEPITAYAAVGKPIAYFDYQYKDKNIDLDYGYDVYRNYTNTGEVFGPYQTYTGEEWNLLNATRNITVPDGVTSIDVNGYMNSGANNGNVAIYLTSTKLGEDTRKMYNDSSSVSTLDVDRINDVQGGLFSGNYNDEVSGEGTTKGNDRLESIDLNQVTYLPDYAFDSCENLRSVSIGSACTEINKLPFRGCTSLTSLSIAEDNPKYLAQSRILYSKNDAETYTLEECLETRGKNNDNTLVSDVSDSVLPNVTEIASEAFDACNFVTEINLGEAKGLTRIPENCFRDCSSLIEIDLPTSVNKIDAGAFAGDNKLNILRIPGREVFISTDAFEADPNKTTTYLVTYDDSSAQRYAKTYGEQYDLVWRDIGNLWDVKFYDMDGTLISATQVESSADGGGYLRRNQIPETPVHEGYRFEGWIGTNGVDIYNDPITQNVDVIAKFSSLNGTVDGNYIVIFLDGVTGEQLGPTQLIPEGEAAVEPAYKFHEGYTFLRFSEESTNVTKNMSIVALYEVDSSSGTGTGTTSGGTTASGGSGTTAGSSTSTTSTSASTSSTSSGAAARHTVTVVNGYGSGSYAVGETVIIVADVPDGQKFKQWRTESNGVNLVMVLASATTFTMPDNNVLVTAEFEAGTPSAPTPTPVGAGTVSTNTTPVSTADNNGNTRVDITKPGISNKDLATANVNGSTDNFIVKISETPEATQAVVNALTNKYGNLDDILYYAMDISLYDSTGTTKITDTTGLTVDITIPLPDALITYGGNNMMGAVVSDQLEDMSERFTTISGVPCISFTATHFSPYTIYVNTQNLSEGLLDTTPKTGDPIHPKWFLSLGLACLSIILFMKKDRKAAVKTV